MAVTTLTALVAGAMVAGTAMQVKQAQDTRKEAKRQAKKQATAAAEAAKLSTTPDTSNANYTLGAEDETVTGMTTGRSASTARRTTSVIGGTGQTNIGGL